MKRVYVDEIQDLYGDIGISQCDPVKILLRDNATPYSVCTARRVPIPLLPQVEAELRRMEDNGIIDRVTEPTDWCAPMIPVMRRKKGTVRICVDLRRLNESVMREKRTLPILDDALHKLTGSTVFSKLDASSGCLQIPLDPGSSKLTTFDHNTLRSKLFPEIPIRYYKRAGNLPRQDGIVTRRSTRSGSHYG